MTLFNRAVKWGLGAAGALAIGYTTLFPAAAQETEVHKPSSRYAIVVKDATYKNPKWRKVVDALDERYNGEVFRYIDQPEEVVPKLREYKPKQLAVVGTVEDVSIPELPNISPEGGWASVDNVRRVALGTFAIRINRMANRIDDDSYRDAEVGIVTGYGEDDALRIATTQDFEIENALLKADEDKFDAFPNSVGYSEDNERGDVVRTEKRGQEISRKRLKVAGDDIVDTINNGGVQLICTTGHGNHNQWRITYNDARDDRWLFSQNGTVYLVNPSNSEAVSSISSTVPKVVVFNGNCREGSILNRNSMTIAWGHSGGAVQVIGYQTDTWFGATGWGINEQMFNNPGISWSEGHMMAELALQDRRERMLEARGGGEGINPNLKGDNQLFGHIYDSDNLTSNGDPGTRATIRFDPNWTPYYTKSDRTETKDHKETYRFAVHINKEGLSKPMVFPTDQDLTGATVTTTPSDLHVRVVDNAVIMDPFWQTVTKEEGQLVIKNREVRAGDDYTASLTVTK